MYLAYTTIPVLNHTLDYIVLSSKFYSTHFTVPWTLFANCGGRLTAAQLSKIVKFLDRGAKSFQTRGHTNRELITPPTPPHNGIWRRIL
jgi:hypothetical protein